VATAGQTNFVLPSIPIAVLSVYINGTGQSQSAGDFTMSGNVLILNASLSNGDLVAGVYVR
jgi:hypothetical protein